MERLRQQSLSSRNNLALIVILTAGGLRFPAVCYGQNSSVTHQIELYLPYYQFLDGSRMKGVYSTSRTAEALGRGIRYAIHFKTKHSISLSASLFDAGYYKRNPVPLGEIRRRETNLINLSYHFHFLQRNRLSLAALGGITSRRGSEQIVLGYPRWFEIVTKFHVLKDWGLHAGLRADYYFWKHFNLSLETNYTAFLLRYDCGQPPHGFDRGSTIHQLGLNVGLGFTFGKRSFEEGGE